jgi:hypothetical protein
VTTGLEEGATWIASYYLQVDKSWRTRFARIATRTTAETFERTVESVGDATWMIDGQPAEHLDGCLDVDLESSAMTNALPVHRLGLGIGESTPSPAVYVRVNGGMVDRLEQTYARVEDRAGHQCYEYEAPEFDFRCQLTYDRSGLVLVYPGIAIRAG